MAPAAAQLGDEQGEARPSEGREEAEEHHLDSSEKQKGGGEDGPVRVSFARVN